MSQMATHSTAIKHLYIYDKNNFVMNKIEQNSIHHITLQNLVYIQTEYNI